MTTGVGPRPWWNGIGFGLGTAFVIAALVILYAPAAPVPEDGAVPTSTAPGPTITLDDLQAMLTDTPGEPPPSVQVETPDGPVTVIIPPTTSTTTTSTTPPPTTTSTTVPVVNHPPDRVTQGILDDLLGREQTTTTIPEGAGGDT